jgi:hypothetical protein
VENDNTKNNENHDSTNDNNLDKDANDDENNLGLKKNIEIEIKSDLILASVITNELNNENEKNHEINLKDISMKKVMMRYEMKNLISQFKSLGTLLL